MFKINPTDKFKKKAAKLIKKTPKLKSKIESTLKILVENPFYPSLKSHKVNDSKGRQAFSSYVTGDLRILWDYSQNHIQVLDILDIGGHSGGE